MYKYIYKCVFEYWLSACDITGLLDYQDYYLEILFNTIEL